jgi:anaerobic nitric oxide reductase transcription regulator
LENVVQRAVVLSEERTVEIACLPATLRTGREEPVISCAGEGPQLSRCFEEEVRRFKRDLVLRTLRECGWSKTESARSLGVARGYLHRLINHLGIQEAESKSPVDQDKGFPGLGPVM